MIVTVTAPTGDFAHITPRKPWTEGETKQFTDFQSAIRWLGNLDEIPNQDAPSWHFEKTVMLSVWGQRLQEIMAANQLDPASPQEEIDVLLNEPRTLPLWEGREWTNACPLIVIHEFYDDTASSEPTGNVYSLHIDSDRDMIRSLAATGVIVIDENYSDETE